MPRFLTWLLWAAGGILVLFFLIAKRLKPNRWGGIRFPYTLADEEIWRDVHARFRWGFLLAGAICFWPTPTYEAFQTLAIVLVSVLIVTSLWAYFYARKAYKAKYGVTKVVSKGFLMYGPPESADQSEESVGVGSWRKEQTRWSRGLPRS